MAQHLDLGRKGEALAKAHLENTGYEIMDENWTHGRLEVDLIAYKKNAETDASLSPVVEFFAFLRNLTADGFFTNAIGIEYLGYIGNTYLAEFPGCPPVPEA